MKKFKSIFTLILLLASTLAFAQADVKKTANSTTLKGSLKNAQRDFFIFKQQGRSDTIRLGENGSFELMIEQASANYFVIEHAKQSVTLFLLPADEMTISLNATNLIDAKDITGKSAPYCNYLLQKQKADRALQNQFGAHKVGALDSEVYYAVRDSIRAARNSTLQKEAAANKFSDYFTEVEKKSFDYQMGYELVVYRSQAAKAGVTTISPKINAFNSKLDLNDEKLSYEHFFDVFALNSLAQYASEKYFAGTDKSALHYYELEIDEVCARITSQKNKSILLSELMPQLMKDVGTQDLRNIISKIEACSNDKKLLSSIKKASAQYEYLYAGKPAPNAAFYDATGKPSKLSDYKGKVVYVDTWATWCGPCKREIPFLKTLEAEYHGKNVAFISVSTDKDVNAWKNFISSQEMSGLQLHQSDNLDESISKLYIVNSIPRFILIDEAGNIVSSDAPRPSSGTEIRGMLDKLLAD